jgi:uncharacterized membrane protein YeiH
MGWPDAYQKSRAAVYLLPDNSRHRVLCVMVSAASKGMGGGTIRAKLLKIGAAVVCNTRRVRMLLASSHPLQHIFMTAARELAAP